MSNDKMNEQENIWREDFEEIYPKIYNKEAMRDYQSLAPLNSKHLCWIYFRAACQSMQAQVDEMDLAHEGYRKLIQEEMDKIKQLETELEKEKAVVDFYAEVGKWHYESFISEDCNEVDVCDDRGNPETAGGKLARERQKERGER